MAKNKIKRLIKRYKIFVYGLILILGIILIIIACTDSETWTVSHHQYDILIGIGCSIISSVIVTSILLILLPDLSEEKQELDDWGICGIYGERSSIKIDAKHMPKHVLYFTAFGLSHFRGANEDVKKIAVRIQNGLDVRIITMNPNSAFLLEQENIENNKEIKQNIEELIGWVGRVKRKCNQRTKGSIEIKFYDSIPLEFFCRADEKIYVGPYIPGKPSGETITYCYNADSKGGKFYFDNFENIWKGESRIKISDKKEPSIYFNQEMAVVETLKYFCKELQGDLQENVVGVIAIFKEGKRRTFFSCNKPHEDNHKCHGEEEGTVGRLVKKNKEKSPSRCLLWSDYKNGILISYKYGARKKCAVKEAHDIKKLENNEETNAILAFPLFAGDRLFGVLTFDFVSLPKDYESKIKELEKMDNEAELSSNQSGTLIPLFLKAEQCARIVTPILGNAVLTKYRNLYEEEW